MTFEATEEFWRNFYRLSSKDKESVREKWQIFKSDPFDPRLRSHTIHKLSAIARHTILSAVISGDLRVLFRVDGSVVTTPDVGSHALYR